MSLASIGFLFSEGTLSSPQARNSGVPDFLIDFQQSPNRILQTLPAVVSLNPKVLYTPYSSQYFIEYAYLKKT